MTPVSRTPGLNPDRVVRTIAADARWLDTNGYPYEAGELRAVASRLARQEDLGHLIDEVIFAEPGDRRTAERRTVPV